MESMVVDTIYPVSANKRIHVGKKYPYVTSLSCALIYPNSLADHTKPSSRLTDSSQQGEFNRNIFISTA